MSSHAVFEVGVKNKNKPVQSVSVECSLCFLSLFQFEMKEHALTHGYPECLFSTPNATK